MIEYYCWNKDGGILLIFFYFMLENGFIVLFFEDEVNFGFCFYILMFFI